MGYAISLEQRIEQCVDPLQKRKMFGGVCYLLNGNMCFGIWKDYLIVRLGPEAAMKKLKQKHTKPFDITGRPMRGWVMVAPPGYRTKAMLKRWLGAGMTFAATLPVK